METWITEHWQDIINITASVIGTAKVIAAATTNETDNKILGYILKFVDLVGLVGNKTQIKEKRF